MRARTALTLLAATSVSALGYASLVERTRYTLRQVTVPVLPAGSRPLTVLHISDVHLTPGQDGKVQWIADLERLNPDLVVTTGDNIAHPDAVPVMIDALGALLDRPGIFVFGSNDYNSPKPKNPARYFLADSRTPITTPELPWRDLRDAMLTAGWMDANNARGYVNAAGLTIEVVGVDDPHIDKDDYPSVAGPADPDADLTLGITHSPEPRVLDAMVTDGAQLILAGHTHGGQLCIPGYGALVTNCGLDRGRVKGLSEWQGAALHVSAGLGTSPYAPVRFACPPEATLLTLTARS